ncbi:MAG: hypothetical protein QM774_06280 [Gordonia sp. (in: high G+C Gram-positive bacteria)]|uniref:hypothetical protein n=1 Tax=Gordonia sp. (in: high G+C Gram-positive bacteria) TaxID=84139 RepID=UPI0039E69167
MRAASAAIAGAVLLGVTACGGEEPAPSERPSVSTTTVTTESTQGADAARTVCLQVITSAGVMVRDYNTFITRLNQTQDYSALDKEDRYARETLDTGAGLIRKAEKPEVPSDLDDKVQAFLTSTDQLSEQIGAKRKVALNRATTEWSDKRTALINACGEFMPTGG